MHRLSCRFLSTRHWEGQLCKSFVLISLLRFLCRASNIFLSYFLLIFKISCAEGKYQDGDAKTFCKTCEKGKYAADSLVSSCSDCDAGTYQSLDVADLNKCTTCESGLFTAATASTSCGKCPKGKYLLSSSSSRIKEDHNEASDCKNCPVGFYGPFDGKSKCFDCEGGAEEKLERCSGCIPGKKNRVLLFVGTVPRDMLVSVILHPDTFFFKTFFPLPLHLFLTHPVLPINICIYI